jgi:prolyl-tRNA editing enzyme YbaK/EbsC (Cys-tRNA(Pro) deacylase)
MHDNALRVQAELEARGLPTTVVELERSTRTSHEAAEAIGTTVAQIAKSLVFEVGERPVLVIASGTNRVSEEKLARIFGSEVRMAGANAVKAATGFPIGGVPPIGHSSVLEILIDDDLLHFDHLWAAAGTPNAVFPISPERLVAITDGKVADIKEDKR